METRVDRRAVPVHDDLDAGHRVSGAADSHFGCVVRRFSSMFPARRFGGGALAVYLDGQPVVDVWTGWSDRGGHRPWSADSAAMVFSATKGMAATVIHRLADRGLIDYEAPVAEYWPEFAANGKASLTVRDVMRHTAGLSGLRGASAEDLLDHVVMEERLAAAAPGTAAGQVGVSRADLRLADVRPRPGRDRKRHASADPRGARRAVGHRRVVSGSPAGRRADAGRRDRRAAEPSCGTRSSAA